MRYLLFLLATTICNCSSTKAESFFEADHPHIQYTGRIDFSNPKAPRFWTAGVYVQFKYKGTSCEITINDEMQWGNMHNYIEIVVDSQQPYKFKTTGKVNKIKIGEGLKKGEHSVTIVKNTEALIGYLEFVGVSCEKLLPPAPKPARKIEFFGNSITSGMGNDLSPIPCGQGEWYDQHNAYYSYCARVARELNAQYHLSSESGIGLIHSCCDKQFTMPRIYNKVSFSLDSILWDFSRYQPDVVTVCLGQNDGIQDSLAFTSAYIDFLKTLRRHYPKAEFICLTSPMADAKLNAVLQNYLKGIVGYMQVNGDKQVDLFFYGQRYHSGCGDHPDLEDHKKMAAELTPFIKKKMKW